MATTVEKGRAGEDRAVQELVRRGYAIVERNARTKRGEIDVVAKDGDVLVFVEVRSRADDRFGAAKATVGFTKQERVVGAAAAWLMRLRPPWPICRFDVVAIEGDRVDVVQGAFEARP
jgi:putative endonuclease